MKAEREGQPLFWQAMGQAQSKLGDVKSAETAFRQAANLDAGFKQPRVSLAELSLAANRPADALRFAAEAIAIDPYDGRARLLHAIALQAGNRMPEATAELHALVKASPGFEDAQLQLALIDLSSKHYADAQAIFSKFYRVGDDDLRALTGLAQVYIAQGQSQRAMDALNEDLKHSSDPDDVRRLLAQIALVANQPGAAVQQYTEILKGQRGKTGPSGPAGATGAGKSAQDYYQLAQAYRAKGDVPAAISNLEQADRITPGNPGILSLLAFLLQQSDRNKEAADKFRQALKLRPDDSNTQNNLAYALAESGGDLDEALRLAESAMRAAPHEPSYADTAAVIYLKKKMPDAALQTLRNVARSAPDNPTYMYHLALAEMDTGRKVEARATLTAALQKKPSKLEGDQIREALARASR